VLPLDYEEEEEMFPTHVGMNRKFDERIGDKYMFPTHVGMNRRQWQDRHPAQDVPHTRGDEPP